LENKSLWLVLMIASLLLIVGVSCYACLDCLGKQGGGSTVVGDADVDLEAVVKEYKAHARTGAKDLSGFEDAVNRKSLYTGPGRVKALMLSDGSVVGYVDQNADGTWSKAKDRLVFKLEADHKQRNLYATDRHHRRYRSGLGDLFGIYLVSRMFDHHRGYYGGWHRYGYSGFMRPGYYGNYRRSLRTGSTRSTWGRSSGSSSRRTRSGSGGGFRFGK